MALEDFTQEEIVAINKFLGDGTVWREMGRTRPARDFDTIKKMAEQQKDIKKAVDDRLRRERELLDRLADENGRIGGILPLVIQNACRRIVGEGAGNMSVYLDEETFKRYTTLLKTVCQEIERW